MKIKETSYNETIKDYSVIRWFRNFYFVIVSLFVLFLLKLEVIGSYFIISFVFLGQNKLPSATECKMVAYLR